MNHNLELQNLIRGGLPLDKAVASSKNGLGSWDFNHMIKAMTEAQDLKVGDPRSGEVGVILESILELLEKLTPQFLLRIVLFDETQLGETPDRVFCMFPYSNYPTWIGQRSPGQSTFLPSARSLPTCLVSGKESGLNISSAVAIPLYKPPGNISAFRDAQEAGLLFLLAGTPWPSDTAIRLGVKLSQFITHRWNVHDNLNKKIHVDSLTGLFNRGYFDGHFPLFLERAKRNKTSLSLIVADIDFFKTINTDYGLLIGDQVLQMVARRLKEEVRKVDVVCRRGGEEFNIILPESDFEAAREVITRLLNAPFQLMANIEGKETQISINLSFGVSIYPDNGTDPEQLHKQAENSMFLSKDRGRNRCHYWRNNGNHLEQFPI